MEGRDVTAEVTRERGFGAEGQFPNAQMDAVRADDQGDAVSIAVLQGQLQPVPDNGQGPDDLPKRIRHRPPHTVEEDSFEVGPQEIDIAASSAADPIERDGRNGWPRSSTYRK